MECISTFAKISRGGERFWCQVLEKRDDGKLKVKVDNHLVCTATHGLLYGDEFIADPDEVMEFVNTKQSKKYLMAKAKQPTS